MRGEGILRLENASSKGCIVMNNANYGLNIPKF